MSPSDSDDAAMLPADTAAEDKEGLMPVATADNAQVEPPPKKRRPRRLKAIDPVAGEPLADEAPPPALEVEAQVKIPPSQADAVPPSPITSGSSASPTPVPAAPAVIQPERVARKDDFARDDDDDDEEDEDDDEDDDLDRARKAADREQRNAPQPQPIRFADVVSGQFDADEDSPEVPALKRVLLPEADSPKLHKVWPRPDSARDWRWKR